MRLTYEVYVYAKENESRRSRRIYPNRGARVITDSNAENRSMVGQNDSAASKQKELGKKHVFACNTLALNAEERKRHLEITKQVRAITKEERELSDGYGFRF